MKNKRIWNSLTKIIFKRLSTSLAIFSSLLFGILILGKAILASIKVWYVGDQLYQIGQLLETNILSIWLIGVIIICLFFLFTSLKYIDLLINASSQLVSLEEQWISFPKELSDIEKRMNEIKQTAIRNANKAIENEQRKNDLIVYLAHDIKTPLTSIIGYLSLLNDEENISEKTKQKYVNITLNKSYQLEHLINELFDVARYNSENIILEKYQLNLSLMIEQIIDEFYPVLKEQNKNIQFDIDQQIIFHGDSNKLARVFNNIIKNAIYYSFQDSTIIIQCTKKDNSIIIDVINHGRMIPESKLNRIFEPFYRVDSSRNTQTGSAGLGLAIAKDIVELHDGKISVSSNESETRFSIVLPCCNTI